MKIIGTLSLLISLSFLVGCRTAQNINNKNKLNWPVVSGSIEIDKYQIKSSQEELGTIEGVILDENGEGIPFMSLSIDSTSINGQSDIDGRYKLEGIKEGRNMLRIEQLGMTFTVLFDMEKGDQVELNVSIALFGEVELLKPIIYIYPEEKTIVEVELVYDGKITTTYPKYPKNGWKITASPDGTLIDTNGKEYYALYWEGKPRNPLKIDEGFIVSKEETIPFLEEKLALLGLNSKESNEFIIFWLPILEKNPFNLIHFAGDDYLKQAELKLTPTPETLIRVAMVFKGLDELLDFPVQDLTQLTRTRSGFTVIEWGGQELPKEFNMGI